MQLYILGPTGSINLPYASSLVRFGQIMIMPDWLSHALALVPGVVLIGKGMRTMRQRRAANLSALPLGALIIKALVLTVALEVAVFYLNLGRGVPWVRHGRKVLYDRMDVLAYIERNRTTRTDDPRGVASV